LFPEHSTDNTRLQRRLSINVPSSCSGTRQAFRLPLQNWVAESPGDFRYDLRGAESPGDFRYSLRVAESPGDFFYGLSPRDLPVSREHKQYKSTAKTLEALLEIMNGGSMAKSVADPINIVG